MARMARISSCQACKFFSFVFVVLVLLAGCNLEDGFQGNGLSDSDISDGISDGDGTPGDGNSGDSDGTPGDSDSDGAPGDDDGDGDGTPEPSCDDGLKNGEETDVDCGGPDCSPCDLGQSCLDNLDCESEVCDSASGLCIDPSCDGVSCPDETCYQGECFSPCINTFDCDPEERCFRGACLPLNCEGVNCPPSRVCALGICYDECTDAGDCPNGDCIDGACVIPTCNDGLQNGLETDIDCGGPDCPGCDVGLNCVESTDCKETEFGPWSSCVFPDEICAQEGIETREVTLYVCNGDGTCEAQFDEETRSCSRDTSDLQCGSPAEGTWSNCSGFSSECSTQGTRSRTNISYQCGNGQCQIIEQQESESCTRSTNDEPCGDGITFGDWTSCEGFSGTCGQTGSRSRTRFTHTCGGGQCQVSSNTVSETCTRNTNGTSCDVGVVEGPWGQCQFSSACSNSGTRTRTITTYSCSNGSCSSSNTPDSEPCTRNTNGTTCGAGFVEGNWGSCSYSGECSNSGTRSRTDTTYACSAGSCQGTPVPVSESCSRNTSGNSCGPGVVNGNWGSCSFSNNCTNSGTRTRNVTTHTCNTSGSCASSSSTQTDTTTCARNTNGTTCGTPLCTNWSNCPVQEGTCQSQETRTCTSQVCSSGSCSPGSSTPETRACNPGACSCSGSLALCDVDGSCNCGGGVICGSQTCGPGATCCGDFCCPQP